MEQEEAAIVSRQTKSCRREVAQLQLLSKVTNCFHCALLFADSCRVQHKIRSQLLTESWKKANYCLTSLLKWQCCPQDCETYSIKLNLLLPTMTTVVSKSTRTKIFTIANFNKQFLAVYPIIRRNKTVKHTTYTQPKQNPIFQKMICKSCSLWKIWGAVSMGPTTRCLHPHHFENH